MSEFVLYLCKVMEEKRISSPLFCAIPCTASSRFLSQQVPCTLYFLSEDVIFAVSLEFVIRDADH